MGWPFLLYPRNWEVLVTARPYWLLHDQGGAHVAVARHVTNKCVGAWLEVDGSGIDIALRVDLKFECAHLCVAFGDDERVAHGVIVDVPKGDVASGDWSIFLGVESQSGFGLHHKGAGRDGFGGFACSRATARRKGE